ncbi:TetR/AcrR family transcriptional regulator [Nocardioides ultimimeridianus]
MSTPVNDRRAARVAETEQRILDAAAELFVREGYQATTLTAVADAAGVAHRTVYVRFGTKVALLRRTVDVAVAGDTEHRSVAERAWVDRALTAATLTERVDALVAGSTALHRRAADLFEVALGVQSAEPEIAEAFAAGRTETRRLLRQFVGRVRRDGLVVRPDDRDTRVWQEETIAMAFQAETYLLLRRTTGWSSRRYAAWLRQTVTAVLAER